MAISFSGIAQTFSVKGKLINSNNNSELVGAVVSIYHLPDSILFKQYSTQADGSFLIENVNPGVYFLKSNYMGYKDLRVHFTLINKDADLGVIKMEEDAKLLKEVKVEDTQTRQEIKGDTTVINAAAFKTHRDANVEDLITKMPGITVENGVVKAQGEDLKKVTIDGREYFGDDATMALKNIPSEVVDKIQIFDRLSDQAQFTGFDDGNSQKAMNIVTKGGMRNAQLGKFYGAYGTDDRYSAGGSYNYFKKARKISIIGVSNNINQQNFSSQDLVGISGQPSNPSGMGMRRGGGSRGSTSPSDASNFTVNNQNGISTTRSLGVNFSDSLGKKISLASSLFLNESDNQSISTLERNYFNKELVGRKYDENKTGDTKNQNARFNARLEYAIDSSNSIIYTPRFSLQDNSSQSVTEGLNAIVNSVLNTSSIRNQSNTIGYNINNELLYRHKFHKKGRTISFNITDVINNKYAETGLYSRNEYYDTNSVDSILIHQTGQTTNNGNTITSRTTYTEPISKISQLQIDHHFSLASTISDKKTYDVLLQNKLDTLLSNHYKNNYTTHRVGLSYRVKAKKTNGSIGANYQYALLDGFQTFPLSIAIKKNFESILPNFTIQHNFTKTTYFRLGYRTSTNPPSLTQLQNVIDNSNTLLLSTGNPDLKQDYTHRIYSRFGNTNPKNSRSLFVFAMASFTQNYIANSTLIATADTMLNDGVLLRTGSQLVRPVNMNGYANLRTFVTYSIPVSFIKSNLNMNGGITYAKTPGLINNIKNNSSTYNFNGGAVVSSNISEKVDFTLSYTGNYNIVKNSIRPELNNNYYYQVSSARFNWLFGKGFVLSTDVNYTSFTGLSAVYNLHYILWNAGFGYKFMPEKVAELKIIAFDLLKQNNSISRNVTETYTEDLKSNVLQRYFMLMFTYQLRKLDAKKTQ